MQPTIYTLILVTRIHLETDRDATDGDKATLSRWTWNWISTSVQDENCVAYVAIVGAADRVGLAGVASSADDGDGTAVETDRDIQILDDDPQKTKLFGSGGRASLNEERMFDCV